MYSEYREGATNLFKPSALLGGFKYQRSYKFSNGATWSSYHNIKFDPQTKALQGTFMTRDFPVEKFEGRRYHIQVGNSKHLLLVHDKMLRSSRMSLKLSFPLAAARSSLSWSPSGKATTDVTSRPPSRASTASTTMRNCPACTGAI